MEFKTKGVCVQIIRLKVEDGILTDLQFEGGNYCDGNLKAMKIVTVGQKVDTIIENYKGITCGPRKTSCADQLSQALVQKLEEMKAEEAKK